MDKVKSIKYRKLFAAFFIVMLLLTILSRILNSLIVPKVQISAYSSGSLAYVIEGEGTIKAADTGYIDIPRGIKVDRVLSSGEKVTKGQGIIFLKISDLESKKIETERELTKLLLSLEKEKLGAKTAARISEQEKMAVDLVLEEKKATKAIADMQKKQEEYYNGVKELNTKRDRDKGFVEQQLALSKEEVERFNKEFDSTVSGGQIKKNNSQAELAYNIEVSRIEEEYKTSLQQLEQQHQEAILKVDDLQDSYSRLLYNDSLAAKTDESITKNEQTALEISGKSQGILQVDIDAKKEELQKLENLLLANGQVESSFDGVITKMAVIPGSVTSGEEIAEISGGEFLFSGALNKDDTGRLAEGDKLDLSVPTETKSVAAIVSNITINIESDDLKKENNYAEFTARLESGNYRIGSSASYKINKSSKMDYPCLIPLEALREDQKGNFCLIAEKNSTILGEEDIAVRINLLVLEKNDSYAAVSGALMETDRIIEGSNKSIKEGDRVRIQP